MDPELLLTIGDCARELQMSPDWLLAQVNAGRLRAIAWDTGATRRTLRVRRADLDAFVRTYRHDARDLPPPSER
jgi:hypothetical protein